MLKCMVHGCTYVNQVGDFIKLKKHRITVTFTVFFETLNYYINGNFAVLTLSIVIRIELYYCLSSEVST